MSVWVSGQRDVRAPDTVFVGFRVEIHTARVRRRVIGIRRGHFADAPDRDGDMRIGRRAQLIEEVHVRDFPEQFVLGSHGVAAARGRDLKVEMAEQVAVFHRPALHEQRGRLKFVRRRRQSCDGGTRNTDDEIRSKVRDQVLAHQRQRGDPRSRERHECESSAFDRAERDHRDSTWREVDEAGARVHADHPPGAGRRLGGADRDHVRIRKDHEFLRRIVPARIGDARSAPPSSATARY